MILDKGVSARLSWKMRGVLAAVGLTVLAVSPWVVAEEKNDLPDRKSSAARGRRTSLPRRLRKGQATNADGKIAYRVACKMFVRENDGKEHATFSPQIALPEGEAGTISVGGSADCDTP